MSSKRSLDERVEEKERQLNEMLERAKQYQAQLKSLQAKKTAEERKARAHRLIETGAAVESVLGQPIYKEDLPKLLDWLEAQEHNGKYFSRAMGIEKGSETTINSENLNKPETAKDDL